MVHLGRRCFMVFDLLYPLRTTLPSLPGPSLANPRACFRVGMSVQWGLTEEIIIVVADTVS